MLTQLGMRSCACVIHEDQPLPPMAFLQQLRLLLWKNGLGIIRRPVWSLTLIVWPLIIFIIMAVTRHQFPSVLKEACYVGPRNLPSAGFFPFLQTLMCNTDSTCHNKSRSTNLHTSKSVHRSSVPESSMLLPRDFDVMKLVQGTSFSADNVASLLNNLNNVLGQSNRGGRHRDSFMNTINTTLPVDQEDMNMESWNVLKKFICNIALPMINNSDAKPVVFAVVTFCKSNDTVLEVALITLNHILTELMVTKPNEMMTAAGMVMLMINDLQHQTSVWESLLAIPKLLSLSSFDQVLGNVKLLLTSMQGALHFIQQKFVEAEANTSVSMVHPLLTGGINLINYVQNWPGKDVSIILGDIVTLQNDSLSEAVKTVLQNIKIPLDKAIYLSLDRDMVHFYICNNSGNPVWLTAACTTGAVDMFLGWISPDKVAKQALLAWSKYVASHDLVFAKGLLHSLMGPGGPGGFNITRARRSVNIQPQNIEEELFLAVGQVVMDIIENVPEVDMAVQDILRTVFQSMMTARLTIDTVKEMMENVLKEVDHLQKTFHILLANQSEANLWIERVLDNVAQITIQQLISETPLTCEDVLSPFEWLLPTNSIKPEGWRLIICQNSSMLKNALVMNWLPLIQMALEVYNSTADYKITLPMILSEWHKLCNNSRSFGMFLDSLAKKLSDEQSWLYWMPDNSTQNATGTLQQSIFSFLVNFGIMFEKSPQWPLVKNSFHMVYWIVNYRPGVTTQPTNCSVDVSTLDVHCDTGLNWPQFVQALMSQTPDTLLSVVKGTVALLEHLYSDIYKHQAELYLRQEIQDGNALSAYLINLMNNLAGFVQHISTLDNQNTSSPAVMLPLIGNLLQSTGLGPLLPLFTSDGPLNVSTVLGVAVKLGRLNQHIFTFSESDPTMPELERLVMRFLNLEGNLTLSLSLSMGHYLLTYSDSFHPDVVAYFKNSIQPFTNQTSSGVVETILSALELLKKLVDSPNGDPTNIILGYLHQLRQFLASVYRLRTTEHVLLPNGQMSTTKVTDLYLLSMDFINLLSPESLQNLTQAGPVAAQNIVTQKFLAFLPAEVQQQAAGFLQDFQSLQHQIASCTSGQSCTAAILEIFSFLDQILEMMLAAEGNVTINVAPINSSLESQEFENMATMFFSLLLSPKDAAYLKKFRQALYFIRLVMATPNVTLSHVQNALRQSNLTIEELKVVASLSGAANLNNLMVTIMEMIKVRQCFEPQHTLEVTAQCVVGVTNGLSDFLKNIPSLHNETAILSFIQLLLNKSISDVVHSNYSSSPYLSVIHTLSSTLANVKMSLQLLHLNTPEIMNEIRVLEGLLKLAVNSDQFSSIFNSTLMNEPTEAQKVYLEIMDWYLKRLENITSNSSVSGLLHPFYRLIELQVALQLAQTNFSLFVSNQVEHLIASLQHPLDGAGVSEIGQITINILRRLLQIIKYNLESQNKFGQSLGTGPLFNTTILCAIEYQIGQYLDLVEKWMKHPNVTLVLPNMLQWGNSSMNATTPVRDLHFLLQTLAPFLSNDQKAYLSIIDSIIQSLNQALMVTGQPGGLQSDHYSHAILKAVQTALQILTTMTGPLPPSIHQDILGIVQDSVKLVVHPDMSFVASRNLSLLILKRAENIIQQTIPPMASDYLLALIKTINTYFGTVSTTAGPDNWNNMILNQMKVIRSLLPPKSTAQACISVLINITHFILEPGQGNMNLWEMLENTSGENVPMTMKRVIRLVNMLLTLITGHPGIHVNIPPLEDFSDLAPVLAEVMTGQANQNTWDRLEKVLKALLSTIDGTQLWDQVPYTVAVLETVVRPMLYKMQADTVMINNLEMPIVTLVTTIVHSVNTSHFNLSTVTEKLKVAINLMIQAVHQVNGTLNCSEVLKAWEPVREAAGLSKDALSMWCNISMQPVLEAHATALAYYANMNMSHVNVEPMNVSATAHRIVGIVWTLHEVNTIYRDVTQHLIMSLSSQLSHLAGWSLSPEAQLQWHKQLQQLQVQNSVISIKMILDQLLNVAPFLQPYTEATERALIHVLNNYHLIPNHTLSQNLFYETAMIFLTSLNLTSDDIFSMKQGNFLGFLAKILMESVKLMGEMNLFGNTSTVQQVLEQILESHEAKLVMQKVAELFAWWDSSEASGMELIIQGLPKISSIFKTFFSFLAKMSEEKPEFMKLIEDLVGDFIEIIIGTNDLLISAEHHLSRLHPQEMSGDYPAKKVRHRREASMNPMRGAMDDFIDLFYIDYPDLFAALSVPPTIVEVLETAHVFFANPNLGVVMKGATKDMAWILNSSREETIDASLLLLSLFTLPDIFQISSMELLGNALDMLSDDFPFSSVLKNITRALANESQENLMLLHMTIQTVAELCQTNLMDEQFTKLFDILSIQVCVLENQDSVQQIMKVLSMEPGQLCNSILPSLKILAHSLRNMDNMTEVMFQAFIGDPNSYNVPSNWTSTLSEHFGFNTSSLSTYNINITSPGPVMVGEMLKNKSAFVLDVQRHMNLDPITFSLLMDMLLPSSNLEILSWLVNLRHCGSSPPSMNQTEAAIFRMFCAMSTEQWYILSLLVARHVNVEKLICRMVLSEDTQKLLGVLLQMGDFLVKTMKNLLPVIGQLQSYLLSIADLNLMTDREFHQMVKGQRSSISSKATFVTLSRALCSKGILAVFGISKLSINSESNPSTTTPQQREEMIERFKLPRNATPFCMNIYLDMVNTTGGAIAWAFLKPVLMGQILYTPDTAVTRAIMEKANGTLQEFANLKEYSEEWIKSSNYIMKSAQILGSTLPVLQNSLSNSFVKNFIEMQTDINVDDMKDTLNKFSNVTVMLEKNKHIMKQITTLSNLMVSFSSCIKFDRYHGYDTADQLNDVAQDLAKNRDLYASVIFKLPKDEDSSQKPLSNSNSSKPSLPPKVSYTIRMHMDNAMRTDRVRDPYFVKDPHILARQTLRYNRGFVYLQENIDRAIIETQTGQKVTEPAVQLQPFPYPCHLRDEYLEAISFIFPIMLMLAWVLFVAEFVKKLVHERELRLHEYMKMMGVNPLSHFFAWFVECATYLLMTIIILTLVMKYGRILSNSDGFILFLFFCDYGLSVLAFSYLVSSFFDKTYIASLSGSLLYILCFFPFIVVMAVETSLTFAEKSALSLFSPTCFSYASQYISRYEAQEEGIQWSNSYTSPIAGDTASFGWLCWMMVIDSVLYFTIGGYIRMVFPGKYGIPAPWYFPFKASFWADLCCCCCIRFPRKEGRGLFFSNIMQKNQPIFSDDKRKDQNNFSFQATEDFSGLPVGVAVHGLTKTYGNQVAIQNLNVSFYEGHVTSLLGHNGAGKTTTMSLLTGLFAPSSGTIEVYGRNMQTNIDDVRRELGVCMQYDVLFDHMTTKEHLLLYGQLKAPHWTRGQLHEQVRGTLEETGMYAHRHKRVGTLSGGMKRKLSISIAFIGGSRTLSGGMKRKLSISIAFIGGSRLVVLDEPTTGVDPCSRRSIWDIVIQHKKSRTIIMSTHHLDEAEVLSDCIAFLEKGELKCCGSPFHLKDKLGQGYKLTLTKKMQNAGAGEQFDIAELKDFIQAHIPEARLKESQGSDLVYSLPSFTSANASSYRSLLIALDANLDSLQLGGYGISDTTLEEVFLQLTHGITDSESDDGSLSISETVSNSGSTDSFPEDLNGSIPSFNDNINLTGSPVVHGMALVWQQITAILIKRFLHSLRDWKGLLSQILLPVLFVGFSMGLGSIKNDLKNYPELELSPELYNIGPSYSFFSNQNPNSSYLVDTMMLFPGIDNGCLNKQDNPVCTTHQNSWVSNGNGFKGVGVCKCTLQEQVCKNNHQPSYKKIPSSQIIYNLSGIDVENYLMATANDFIRNRYGGFDFGMPLPPSLQLDLKVPPKNRTLSKVWFNPEGHHTMPAYLNSLSNFILRSRLPADKDPRKYAISVFSHPYFGRPDDEDSVVQGILQILVAMCVLTGYAITTASFAIYEVHEHHSSSKRLQHIAGISETFYWTVNFFYDMLAYMIPVILTVIVIVAFQIPAFTDRQNLAAVTLLLVLFGFATFPWMYLLSGIFKDAEMAFITYVCINLFISINTIMPTSILYFLSQIAMDQTEVINGIFQKLSCAFLIFPQFSFGNGLMELARRNVEVQLLSGYGIDAYKSPFSMDTLGWMFLSSFIQGLIFFTLRLILNKWLIRKIRHLILGRKKVPQGGCENEDEDVVAEGLRVSSGAASSDILQVSQLSKVYQHLNKKVHAVKRLSIGIPAGECFGLLGVNGAGKTTTFKMLTGDVSPTDGTAQIRDWEGRIVDIMECRNKGINIGYCPQVDALDNLLTGEEHLYFYARIHGISKTEIDGVVNYLLKRVKLNFHRKKITDKYSCGTRRKLSTALALIGHPQILLLDEPSSGMDPHTKRHLWKILSEEVKGKCAVVLTSHSMEECEALCSRLAIMVKGQFRCLGSLQHIKNRFGSGFTVKMYLAQASCGSDAITSFMQHHFPSTYLKDQHSTMVEYHIPVAPGGVADIFNQLESNKNALQIKHFSVSQTTLDEVFINFAMGKIGMETIPTDEEEECDNLDSLKQ
ncbi:hypothetical protein LDENG_00244240 [Lucifuga dentata]|nr:hypothetical protein LDENG_00244240 [Lucifuga dentata]